MFTRTVTVEKGFQKAPFELNSTAEKVHFVDTICVIKYSFFCCFHDSLGFDAYSIEEKHEKCKRLSTDSTMGLYSSFTPSVVIL